MRRAVLGPKKAKPKAPPLRTVIPSKAPSKAVIHAPLVEPPAIHGVGASTPDYKKLMLSDPGYMAFIANRDAHLKSAGADRAAALKALAIRFGGLPAGFKDAFGDITPADLALAQGNQFSEEANLKRQYLQQQTDARRALAARGMLQSGDLTDAQSKLDTARGQQEYNLGNQFLDALNQAIHGYTDVVQGYADQLPDVVTGAMGRVTDLYKPTAGSDASYVAGSAEKYGIPVYKDSNGKLWKPGPNGPQPFTPPAAPPPPTLRTVIEQPVRKPPRPRVLAGRLIGGYQP